VGVLLDAAVASFTARVQAFLPAADVFQLQLRDDKGKPTCDFGFMRDGELHTAVSGAEWVRLQLALTCAVVTPDPNKLVVITPEERAFDPATLREVMVALADAPGQVILTSPIKPKGAKPKGWTIIDVSAEKRAAEKRAAAAARAAKKRGAPAALGTDDDERTRSLMGLGYTEIQISLMTPETAAELDSGQVLASEVSVLGTGAWVRVTPATAEA